jgi:hypothetical protein
MIIGGIYCLLFTYRVVSLRLKDNKPIELWHRKFDKINKICGPIMIIGGILQLLGFLH